jgi:hypothetical protein
LIIGLERGLLESLRIVNNFPIRWAGSFSRPFEANPPLVIGADTVLSLSVPFQRFKTVAR